MTYALLFPGQGAQRCGMLHQLPAGAETDRTLAEAADVLGRAVPGTLDDADAMRGDTVAIQLALVIAGTATARTLTARAPDPGYCAGHSVGAVTAAVAAGALDLPDALDLVRLRGTLMARAYPAGSGHGMAALSGLPERRVDELAARVRSEGLAVYASNVNAPDQVTASGSLAGIDRLVELARVAGLTKAVPLAVPVPAHCRLIGAVTDGLTARLAELQARGRLRRPRCGWVGTRTGRVLRRPEHIARDLADGVAQPVRWHDMTTALYERGVRLFVEAAPGHGLARLAGSAFRGVRAVAIDDIGIDSSALLAARHTRQDSAV
jgi:malonate decarboxylase epsilon subunit